MYRYALMQQCWKDNPNERPTFEQIKTYLEGHLSREPSKKGHPRRNNVEAAAYRPNDGREGVPMRDVIPGSHLQRNDYLSLRQSVVAEWHHCHSMRFNSGYSVPRVLAAITMETTFRLEITARRYKKQLRLTAWSNLNRYEKCGHHYKKS